MFPNQELLDGKYFISVRVDKWLPNKRTSCCGLILDTDDLSEDIDGLFMSIWWEMNWFCGVASALYVRAAAHNHVSDDWQLAVFSLWSIYGKINKPRNCTAVGKTRVSLY